MSGAPNPKDLVGAKKAPLRYVPPALMIAASGPMEDGALKYGPFNWRDYPVEVVTYVEAAIRHLYAFLDGQDDAEDSGHPHIDHAIAGLGIIVDSRELGVLIDNRYRKGPAADMLRDRDKSETPEASQVSAVLIGMTDPSTWEEARLRFADADRIMHQGTLVTAEEWGTGDGPIMHPEVPHARGMYQTTCAADGQTWPCSTFLARADDR